MPGIATTGEEVTVSHILGLRVEEGKGEVESKQLKPLNTLSVDRGRIYIMLEFVRDGRFVEHHTF